MKKIIVSSVFCVGILFNCIFAQVGFKDSRLIFEENKGSISSIIIKNNSGDSPYLAQTWVEDINNNKIAEPFVALPVLQRLNPLQEKQIKVEFVGDRTQLPTDRESLFFLKLLGAPPKSEGNSLGIVIQSTIKLFYRPKTLPKYPTQTGWIAELELQKVRGGVSLHNPTAYHVSLVSIGSDGRNAKSVSRTLKPFSTEMIPVTVQGNNVVVYIMNDYGSLSEAKYSCSVGGCRQIELIHH